MLGYNFKTRVRVFILTLVGIAFFGLIGWAFDKWLDTFPAGFFIGVLVSYPITLWLMARNLRRQFKKHPEKLATKEDLQEQENHARD